VKQFKLLYIFQKQASFLPISCAGGSSPLGAGGCAGKKCIVTWKQFIIFLLAILLLPIFGKSQIEDTSGVSLILPTGHADAISGVDFTADGKQLLSFGKGGLVKVWDVTRGFELTTLTSSIEEVLKAKFSTNPDIIIIARSDFSLTFWDWKHDVILVQSSTPSLILSMINLNESQLLLGAINGFVYTFDWNTKTLNPFFKAHHKAVSSLTKVNDHYFLTGSRSGQICLWDAAHKELKRKYEEVHQSEVSDIVYDNNKKIFYSSDSSKIFKWRLTSEKKINQLSVEVPINALSLSADGKYLAAATNDFNTYVWERKETEQLVQRFIGHNNWVSDVAFSPIHQHLVTSSWDESLLFWNIQSEQSYRKRSRMIDECISLDLDKKGRYLLAGTKEGNTRILDMSTGRQQNVYNNQSSWVTTVQFSPDDNYVMAASLDNTLQLMKAGQEDYSIKTLHVEGAHGTDSALLLNDNDQVVFSLNKALFKGRFSTGQYKRLTSDFQGTINDIDIDKKTGQFLILSEKKAYLLKPDGLVSDSISGAQFFSEVVVHPKNSQAMITCWDGRIYLWDYRKREVRSFEGHKDRATAIAIHPENGHYVSADASGNILIWNENQKKPVRNIHAHDKEITSLTWNGSILVSAAKDFKVKLWNCPSSSSDNEFCTTIASYIPFQEEQFLTLLPNKYYSASNQRFLFEHTAFLINEQLYPLLYIDHKLNRPHLVAGAMKTKKKKKKKKKKTMTFNLIFLWSRFPSKRGCLASQTINN